MSRSNRSFELPLVVRSRGQDSIMIDISCRCDTIYKVAEQIVDSPAT